MSALCDDARLSDLTQALSAPEVDRVPRIDEALRQFPDDPRLHFLRGSVLIEEGRLIEAHQALTQTITLAPDFAIARFQLGLFQLTSGEADQALETWGRLDRLPDQHYLRKFVDGLRCLIRDDFPAAIQSLREGIALNQDNPPLNRDMSLLIDECHKASSAQNPEESADVSQTSLILKQFSNRGSLN